MCIDLTKRDEVVKLAIRQPFLCSLESPRSEPQRPGEELPWTMSPVILSPEHKLVHVSPHSLLRL